MFEQKMMRFDEAELKFDEERGTFSGYASKFDGIDSYGDTFVSGAWDNVVAQKKTIPIFFNHDSREVPIGKYNVIKQDEKGLYVEGALTLSIPKARDVFEALKAGTVNGLSVGFLATEKDFDVKSDGSGRIFKNVTDLREISVVTFPADKQARISTVKSEDIEKMSSVRDLEAILRDSGLSKTQAQTFISKSRAVFAEASLRDSEAESERQILDAFERLNNRL